MKFVYAFSEGSKEQKFLLGGKGANLGEMTKLGLPVPPGFTVSTDACKAYMASGDVIPEGLMDEVAQSLSALEAAMGKRLGDADDPLLVSVRSGAAFSMPGMMDTVLNLGMNDASVVGLAKQTGNERFAYDSYRRFVQMFGKIVLDVSASSFEEALHDLMEERKVAVDTALTSEDLKGLVTTFKAIVQSEAGVDFPDTPQEQLSYAIEAVFKSWNGRRAKDYRKMEGIADDLGTAVNVQTMVFGNKGDDSGTGVAFTRNPSSGESVPYGDFLVNAQGEDVVAGIRMTEPLSAMGNEFPECHVELISVMSQLEKHYRDMCDIEFTIEQGRLFILQTRVGKRTAAAALRMAVEMQSEGMIDKSEAVLRVQPAQLDQLLHPQFDPTAEYDSIAKGLNASPGAAVGKVYFTADEAEAAFEAGERVILVRPETSPDDLHGMIAAEGILTSRGGLVSHAAVVARGMGKPAICGADELNIDLGRRCFSVDRVQADGTTLTTTVLEGEIISINGSTGEVVVGEVAVVEPEPGEHFGIVLGWADEFRTLKVRTNADLPEDCEKALEFGAEGVGLCRTEHMFLGDRLPIVQAMILADTPEAEEAALAALLVQQRIDFEGILKTMDGLPVTVRLLDPPLHEFLPNHDELQARRTAAFIRGSVDPEAEHLWAAVKRWEESNPMLGIRGCRLGILKPALYRLQVRALIEAAVTRKRAGGDPQVEIMVPLTVIRTEMELIDGWIRAEAEAVFAEQGERVEYLVGTMVETPRAAITAGEIAETAEFFSFGTNDLTQMTFGFSRDDVEGRMMPIYLEQKILNVSPFEQLDRSGVGELIRWAKEKGRAVRPDIKLGICGEHGGDPTSVHFCHEIGLDYVSASPYRVPLARLAAAHAALGAGGPGTTA